MSVRLAWSHRDQSTLARGRTWSDSFYARRTSQMMSRMTKIKTMIPGITNVAPSIARPPFCRRQTDIRKPTRATLAHWASWSKWARMV
jgi:hypothetical protein